MAGQIRRLGTARSETLENQRGIRYIRLSGHLLRGQIPGFLIRTGAPCRERRSTIACIYRGVRRPLLFPRPLAFVKLLLEQAERQAKAREGAPEEIPPMTGMEKVGDTWRPKGQ